MKLRRFIAVALCLAMLFAAPAQILAQCIVPANGTRIFTASDSALANDTGKLLIANCASACTETLPSPPPTSVWAVWIRNYGAGVLTISRNTLTIDGQAQNYTLLNGESIYVTTDGTNYFTAPGLTWDYYTGGGTAQAQTATSYAGVTALTIGPQICWLPAAANTAAAPTLAVDGTTAKTITKNGTAALVANDITTTAIACVRYDGTEYQLQNPQTSGSLSVTSGSAGIYLPFIFQPISGGSAAGGPTVNQVIVYPFIIPWTQKLTKIVVSVTTAVASSNCDFGVYDTSGNLLWHSGQFSTAATGSIVTTSGASYTLLPGAYQYGYGCDSSGIQMLASSSSSTGAVAGFYNSANANTVGTAANAYSAGLPSTTGAITGAGTKNLWWSLVVP